MASRMIASAKSWLCHPGVDRQAAILPWGEGDGPKLSPVAAQKLPHDDAAIAYAPVTQLAGWLKGRQLTSSRLTEIYLERITRIAPRLYCYITICAEAARARAMPKLPIVFDQRAPAAPREIRRKGLPRRIVGPRLDEEAARAGGHRWS